MTVIEIYCDECDMPSPEHAQLTGSHVGQRVRQAHPELRRKLRTMHCWTFTHDARDLCLDCALKLNAKDKPPLPNAAANFRRGSGLRLRVAPQALQSSLEPQATAPIVAPATPRSDSYAAAVAEYRQRVFGQSTPPGEGI